MNKMIYLAAPYSVDIEDQEERKNIIEARMAKVNQASVALTARGIHVVTPLSKHYLQAYYEQPLDWDSEEAYCQNLMERCDALYVLMLDGWEDSQGVTAEIKYALALRIQVVYLDETGKVVGVKSTQ